MRKTCELILAKASDLVIHNESKCANIMLQSIEDCGATDENCPHRTECLAMIRNLQDLNKRYNFTKK